MADQEPRVVKVIMRALEVFELEIDGTREHPFIPGEDGRSPLHREQAVGDAVRGVLGIPEDVPLELDIVEE
jgi:hypothetical protein